MATAARDFDILEYLERYERSERDASSSERSRKARFRRKVGRRVFITEYDWVGLVLMLQDARHLDPCASYDMARQADFALVQDALQRYVEWCVNENKEFRFYQQVKT